MKSIFILLFSLVSLFSITDDKRNVEVKIKEDSHLFIRGTSNVNSFTCNYLKPIKSKSFTLSYQNIKNGWLLENAELSLESTSFDCGGRKINNDFKELINSSQFPSIYIEVCEVKTQESNLEAIIQITIAGKANFLPIEISLEEGKDTNYSSVLELNIEDFNLEAPTKMMGLIKVHEEISIHVNLSLELIK